jgi:type II secretion system protein I
MQRVRLIRRKGFTLLEVLVSLAITAMAVTLVLQLFSTNLRAVSRSVDMTSAVVKGDARLREIMAEPSLTERAWDEVTDDGYRLGISVSEVMQEKTALLPVRLMEIVLTIQWMDGMKEKNLTLTTAKMVEKPLK